jgi:hypothetical protein
VSARTPTPAPAQHVGAPQTVREAAEAFRAAGKRATDAARTAGRLAASRIPVAPAKRSAPSPPTGGRAASSSEQRAPSDVHIIFTTDCRPYQAWQTQLLVRVPPPLLAAAASVTTALREPLGRFKARTSSRPKC